MPFDKRHAGRRSFRADLLGARAVGRYHGAMTEKLRSEALALPPAERAELAHALLESLHGKDDADAETAWLDELDRRAQAVADGTARLVDWDDARQRIAARLKARREARTPR
jgi:putative addiction module component (TIGR02574 family)